MSLVRNLVVSRAKRRLLVPVLKFKNGFATDSKNGILTSGLEDMAIPNIPLWEFIFQKAHKWEHLVAAECVVTGRKYTYKEMRTKSKNFGAALRKKFKLKKSDVVAVLLPNVPEFPIVTLGIIKEGMICTSVNPIYTPDEISRQLLDSNAKVIVTLNEFWPLARAATGATKNTIPVITINSQQGQATPEGAANFSELTDNEIDVPDIPISGEDLAFLPYSSGTTGLPKGVQLTHHNLVSNVTQLSHPRVQASRGTTADHQDFCSAVLPFFHIYGFTVLCMHHMEVGAKLLTIPKFTPEIYVDHLRKHKPNMLYVAPPIAIFLTKFPGLTSTDFASVRGIVNGAASLGRLDIFHLADKIKGNTKIIQGFGMSETSPVVTVIRPYQYSDEDSIGSIGVPIPNTILKIIDPEDRTGKPLGPNQTGELLVKGPQVMRGYLNRPEEDEKTFLDGWMRTGDLMYYNEKGYLFVKDRLKELIKVKGFQVAPAELEEIIRDFPDVVDAAVIGIPHEIDGESPRAYVVPRPNTKLDVQKLGDHVASKVAPYKRLKGGISVVESIPKNASGKILRRQLKLKYQEENK